jgi:Carbohydrate binding module (family 6)
MSSAGGASTGGMTGTAGQLVSDAAVTGAGGAGNDSGGNVIDAAPFDGNVPSMTPAGYTGTPFGGAPQTIPGKIEVERYDLGGAGAAFQNNVTKAFNKCGLMRTDGVELDCTDTRDKNAAGCAAETPGEVYLGYIGAGEWYRYTVVVTEPGRYVISGHEGVATNNVKVSFSFTDQTKTEPLTLPSTVGCGGWEAYHLWGTGSALGQIDLVPGKYVMTLTMVSVGMNLDWFAFTKM